MLTGLKTSGARVASLPLGFVAVPSPGHQLFASISQGSPGPRLCARRAPSTRACQPGRVQLAVPRPPAPAPAPRPNRCVVTQQC